MLEIDNNREAFRQSNKVSIDSLKLLPMHNFQCKIEACVLGIGFIVKCLSLLRSYISFRGILKSTLTAVIDFYTHICNSSSVIFYFLCFSPGVHPRVLEPLH